jgi:hypothetical protein
MYLIKATQKMHKVVLGGTTYHIDTNKNASPDRA